MTTLEVRCCCHPEKVIGWLPASNDVKRGHVVTFVVTPARWRLAPSAMAPKYEPMDVVSLPVEELVEFDNGNPVRSLAFKSNDTPIARLRMIRGFVEHK